MGVSIVSLNEGVIPSATLAVTNEKSPSVEEFGSARSDRPCGVFGDLGRPHPARIAARALGIPRSTANAISCRFSGGNRIA